MPDERPDIEWNFAAANLREDVIKTIASQLSDLSEDFARSADGDVIVCDTHVARAANLLLKPELLPDDIKCQLAPARWARVFLSYSSNDEAWAREFEGDLKGAGLSTFLASRSIEVGADWDEEIWEAIRRCRIFVALLTPSALESGWCVLEAGAARGLRKKVVPVLRHVSARDLSDALSQFQAREVQTREQQLRLVRELKALIQQAE
jgi:hypothetical protein